MRSSRSRLAAAQAAVSVVLLLIVYLTLLQPGDGEPLFGVDARQGTEFVAEATFRDANRDASGSGEGFESPQGSPSQPGSTGSELQSGDGGGDLSGTAGLEESGEGTPPDGPPGTDSPSDDQYSDAVARIFLRVGEPR